MTDNSSINLSLTNIWHSWRAFRAGKKPSRDIIAIEADLELNLLTLCYELNHGTYVHGGYSRRIVNEKKRRDIAVACVRDRIVHRLLYDYIVPKVDKKFDPDVWSCRTGKGLHRCLDRSQKLLHKYPDAWVWRADISKFFDSVDHETLKTCLLRLITDQKALNLLHKVISSYGYSNVGIPIGNLTSQIFANIYLNEFDRYVRHVIKPHAYVRYGDDFILFVYTKQEAEQISLTATTWFKDNLKLKVHAKNNIVVRSKHGLHFLGHRIYPSSNVVVEPMQLKKIMSELSRKNVSSYRSQKLPKRVAKRFDWMIKSAGIL
jgi:RNA-directed DNA polymerase